MEFSLVASVSSYLHNEIQVKLLDTVALVGETHICITRVMHPEDTEGPYLGPSQISSVSFEWLVLIFILYNKTVIVSRVLSLVL